MNTSAVLRYCRPEQWDDADYTTKTHYLFELGKRDDEYVHEISSFLKCNGQLNVESLQRVQNPFQYGRFLIRKEQLEFRNDPVQVLKYYHPIHRTDLKTALEYNMDVRRYINKHPGQHEGNKNPKFYKSPASAAEALPGVSNSDKIIIICRVLVGYGEGEVITKVYDSNYLPVYVVNLC